MAGSGCSLSSAWVFPSRSCFVAFAPPPTPPAAEPCFARIACARVRAWPRAFRGGANRAPDCACAREPGRRAQLSPQFPRAVFSRRRETGEGAAPRTPRPLPASSYHGFSGVKPALRNALLPPAGVQSGSRARSRSTNVCTFPMEIFGRGPNTTRRGALKWAILSRQKAMTSTSAGAAPDLLSAYFPSFAATSLPPFRERAPACGPNRGPLRARLPAYKPIRRRTAARVQPSPSAPAT